MSESPLSIPLLNDEDRKRAFFFALPDLYITEWFSEIENALRFSASRLNTLDEYLGLISRSSFVFEDEKLQTAFKSFETHFAILRDFLENNFLTEGSICRFTEQEQIYNEKIITLKNLMLSTAVEHELLVSTFTGTNNKPSKSSLHYSFYENRFVWDGTSVCNVNGKEKRLMIKKLWLNRCSEKMLPSAKRTSRAELISCLGFEKKPEKLTQLLKDTKSYLITKGVPIRIDGRAEKGYVLVVLQE